MFRASSETTRFDSLTNHSDDDHVDLATLGLTIRISPSQSQRLLFVMRGSRDTPEAGAMRVSSFQVVIGIDWADEEHAFCLMDLKRGSKESGSIKQTPEAIAEWVHSLHRRFPDASVAVCLDWQTHITKKF